METKELFLQMMSSFGEDSFLNEIYKITPFNESTPENLIKDMNKFAIIDNMINHEPFSNSFLDIKKTRKFYEKHKKSFNMIIEIIFEAGGKGPFFKLGKSIREEIVEKSLEKYANIDEEIADFKRVINRQITILICLSYMFNNVEDLD